MRDMENRSNMKKTIEGDRLVAFLIINGKTYESDCDHQECLEMYYHDAGIKSEFDYTDPAKHDEVHEAEVHKTYEMKNSHEVYGFDLFDTGDDYILIAHDNETLDKNIGWATKYIAENPDSNILLGYFIKGYDAEIIEERKECA